MQKLPQDHEVPFSPIVEQGKGYVTRRPSAVPLNQLGFTVDQCGVGGGPSNTEFGRLVRDAFGDKRVPRCNRSHRDNVMNLIILVVILLIVFGGGGFYYGGPFVGGGLGTILLIILIVLLVRG